MSDFLYRYSVVDDHSLDGLEKSEFYFATPTNFNDPFDCKNLFTFEGSDDNDWRSFFDMQLQHQEPHLSLQERRRKLEKIVRDGMYKDSDTRKEQLRIWGKTLEEESNKLGIVCLSQKPDDILMWSHYSDKHRGFCLKFDKKIIEKKFYCRDVKYCPIYPTFTEYIAQSRNKKLHETFLLTKSIHWKYEEEYRLINDPSSRPDIPGERQYKYPEEALVGIIWGCQMLERNKKMIEFILNKRKHSLDFFEAKKSENQYAIKIEPA